MTIVPAVTRAGVSNSNPRGPLSRMFFPSLPAATHSNDQEPYQAPAEVADEQESGPQGPESETSTLNYCSIYEIVFYRV